MTFHELCTTLAARASLVSPTGMRENELFDDVWPELLMQAYDRLEEVRYDAVIVDEGQDFLPLWWTAVQAGLDPDGPGLLRIFYDNNQRVYASANDLPKEVSLIPIRLTLNLRNTRRIHELVRQHYTGHEIEAVGPEGVEISWVRTNNQEELGEIVRTLQHACVFLRKCLLKTLPSWWPPILKLTGSHRVTDWEIFVRFLAKNKSKAV